MRLRTPIRILIASLVLATSNYGYYHFVRYASRNAPFNAIPVKFDLNALPDKTVTYHINETGPANFAATDSFALLITQIRSAARVWNDVETSELRLRFGGLSQKDAITAAATPSIEVDFQDLPPGVRGMGGPTTTGEIAGGQFVPILRSVVVLPRDFAEWPSWNDRLFGTLVHEFGHALGLQHAFAGGAMATEITRSTTKIRPLSPDDVIGLSLLYPTRNFREGLGTISGRVSAGTEGMGLASVIALTPGGAAIGALTHPDGSYTIDGLPPGNYYLYAHPLPPNRLGEATPGAVVLPTDTAGRDMPGGQQFDTVFYPASRTPFITVAVGAGQTNEGVNFNVSRRNAPTAIHSVEMFSFPGQRDVKPAHVYTNGARNLVVMTGPGLFQGTAPAPGLQVSAIGGAVSVPNGGLRPYASAPTSFLQMDVQFGQFIGAGAAHLVFSRNNDLYVLPNGLRIADRSAPQIETISPRNENGEVVITGSSLNASSRIAFGGVFATVRAFDENSGRLTIAPPPGASNQVAHVGAYNSDGQSSQFLQAVQTWNYDFDASAAPQFSTTSIPAGTESVIEVSGTGFADGVTSIGFGSPDITVRRVWFVSPNRALVNVAVAPGAAGQSYTVTVLNGLRLQAQSGLLQVVAPTGRTAWLTTLATGLTAGATGSLQVNGWNLTSAAALQLTINDRVVPVTGVDNGTIQFSVPANIGAGPAVVRLQLGGESALPLAVQISPVPALITSVTAGFGTLIGDSRPARPGELSTMTIVGLPENLAPPGSQPRVTMTIAGIEHRPVSVTPLGTSMNLQFIVLGSVPNGNATVNVTIEGLNVQPYVLPVRPF